MPGEFPEYHEPTPGNQGTQAPEDMNIDQVKDPEAGLDITIHGNDWLNKLNPDRKTAEDEMVSHLAEVIPVGNQPAEMPEVTSLPAQPGIDNIAPVADIPEKTAEEQIKAGKDLIDYQAELTYDIANPENVKYSPEQEKNNKVVEGLLEKYPHAFVERSTDDGRKYLLLKRIEGGGTQYPSIFSKYSNESNIIKEGKALMLSYRGVTVMDFLPDTTKYDFTPVLDIEEKRVRFEYGSILLKDTEGDEDEDANVSGFERNNLEDVNLGILKKIFIDMEQSRKDDIIKEKLTAQNILDSL